MHSPLPRAREAGAFLAGCLMALAVYLAVQGVAECCNPFLPKARANAFGTGLSQQAVEPRAASRPFGLRSLSLGEQ